MIKKPKKLYLLYLQNIFPRLIKLKYLQKYNYYFKIKDSIHPHSGLGWWFSIHSTNKYFLEIYNITFINALFTHNAISKNIDDLKDIFNEIKQYKYINETLFSKERNILTLNQPHFYNLYMLNIKKRKVHSIPYKYFKIELVNKVILNSPLFVINTGGNHIPLDRNYKIQKKIMEKRFPYYVKYEIKKTNNIYKKSITTFCITIFKCCIITFFFKINI